MTDDRRNDRRPVGSPKKKNPTTAVGVFVVVVVLLVLGTLLFNAIRDKRQFDEQNTLAVSSDARPATGASQ
ncbi:hypothetical protein [Candidatus Burkholderia verschuerenii]|uniref:hypothetical protein n=1 Tax=Candidatus Burkholderia verschuerenii TaxID=242163 RepID=UPI00067AB75B|nr:hypothetical protein [Candidatus Burkholderia verschuerenii]